MKIQKTTVHNYLHLKININMMPKKLMNLICFWVVIQRLSSLMNKNIGWKGIPQRFTNFFLEQFASYKYRNDNI